MSADTSTPDTRGGSTPDVSAAQAPSATPTQYEAMSGTYTRPETSRVIAQMAFLGPVPEVDYDSLSAKDRAGMTREEYGRRVAVGRHLESSDGPGALDVLAHATMNVSSADSQSAITTTILTEHGEAKDGYPRVAADADESSRAEEAGKRVETYRTYLDKGLDGLTENGKLTDEAVKYLVDPVLEVVRRVPGAADALGIGPNDTWETISKDPVKKKIILRLLGDPYVRKELSKHLNEFLDPSRTQKVVSKEEEIVQAQEELEKAQRDLAALEPREGSSQAAFEEAIKEQDAFVHTSYPSTSGAKGSTRSEVLSSLSSSAEVLAYKKAKDNLEDAIKRGAPQEVIDRYQADVDRWKGKESVKEYDKLQDEYDGIQTKLNNAKETLDKLTAARTRVKSATANLNQKRTERVGMSQDFSRSLDGVFADSVYAVVSKRIHDLTTRKGFGDLGQQVFDEASTRAAPGIERAVDGRLAVKDKKGKGDRELDNEQRKNAEKEVGDFIDDPDAYIRGLLGPDGAGLNPAEIEMLMSDENWVKAMQLHLAKKLFRKLFASGGELTRAQVRELTREDWGKRVLLGMSTARDGQRAAGYISEIYNGGEPLTEQSFETVRRRLMPFDWIWRRLGTDNQMGNRFFRGGRVRTNAPSLMVMSLLGMARPEDIPSRIRHPRLKPWEQRIRSRRPKT